MSCVNQVSIVSWNTHGISNQSTHLLDLTELIQRTEPDIILLQETFLNPTSKFHMPGYLTIRNDRPHHGGGTAIIIKRSIHFRTAQLDLNPAFESTAIKITVDGSPTTLVSIYVPKYTDGLHRQLARVFHNHDNIILAGDFNANHPLWSTGTPNRAGNVIDRLTSLQDITMLAPIHPTYYSSRHDYCSTIDFVLHHTPSPISLPVVLNDMRSDHVAIKFHIGGRIRPFVSSRFDYSKADWEFYRRSLLELRRDFTDPASVGDINAAINKLQQDIIDARDLAVPTATWTCHPQRLSDETIALIRERNRVRRRAHRTRDPDKSIILAQLKIIQMMLQQRITVERNANWGRFTKSINGDTKRFWRVAKALRGRKSMLSSITRLDGSTTSSPAETAEALADKFVAAHNQFHRPDSELDDFIRNSVTSYLDDAANFTQPIHPFTTEDILDVLSSVRPFKAPGTDQIFYILVRQLPDVVISQLVTTLNRCLALGYWPSLWKTAKVVPVRKANASPDMVQSYRPISLLASLNKVLEKLVLSRLNEWCIHENVLPAEQFGFRAKLSATHQAARLAHTISRHKGNYRSVGAVSLDVASAFDSVWHHGLLFKLLDRQLDPHIIRLIANWLNDRRFFVQVGHHRSSLRAINAGCPQGSSLSPLLFNIFTADLHPPDCEVFMFADDVALVAEGLQHRRISRRLNEALDYVDNYYDTWHMKLNHNKTAATFFPLDRKKRRVPADPLTFAGHNVEFSREFKYLGVTFDDRLSFKPHVLAARKRIINATNSLRPMLGRNSKLNIPNKRLLITQIVMPIGLYSSPIWAGALPMHIVYLRRQITRAIKLAYKLEWRTPTTDVFKIANIPLIEELIASRQQLFFNSLAESPNELVSNLRPP